MAVTLTAAADAVFVQVPWSAGDLKQCADRILRADDIKARAPGGEAITWHVLQAHYANGDPTFDAAMWDILERKADGVRCRQRRSPGDDGRGLRPVRGADGLAAFRQAPRWLVNPSAVLW